MSVQTSIRQEYDLGFCTITLLSPHIAEFIGNAAVDVSLDMIERFHSFLQNHLSAPIYLLINKVHSYSYTFAAQRELATIPEIKAIAVVSYNEMSTISAQAMAAIPRKVEWNLQTFSDRDEALAWLNSFQMTELRQVL